MSVEIFRTFDEARGNFGPCALAIGNFDGVHIGHQALIGEAIRLAQDQGLVPAVLTFDPHPTAVVAPDRVPPLICTMGERFRLLGKVGVQRIFVLQFSAELARLTPEEFVSAILVDLLQTKAVFVGDNFRFGYRQSGTTDVFAALGRAYSFATSFLKPIEFRGRVVSSTEIRTDLAADKVVQAARLLGRCYSVEGPVVHGRGIGSRKTVPTLNLKPQTDLVVPPGIFVTETIERETGRRWPSVTSCGYNPTFGATDLTVETYLLDDLLGATPASIEVRFRHFLRPEETYPTAEALRAQILRDVKRAQAYWRHSENFAKLAPSIY